MTYITPTTEAQEMATLAAVLEEVHAEWDACADDDSIRIDDLQSQFNLLQEFEYSGPLSLIYHVFFSGMDTEPREELYQRVLDNMKKR